MNHQVFMRFTNQLVTGGPPSWSFSLTISHLKTATTVTAGFFTTNGPMEELKTRWRNCWCPTFARALQQGDIVENAGWVMKPTRWRPPEIQVGITPQSLHNSRYTTPNQWWQMVYNQCNWHYNILELQDDAPQFCLLLYSPPVFSSLYLP